MLSLGDSPEFTRKPTHDPHSHPIPAPGRSPGKRRGAPTGFGLVANTPCRKARCKESVGWPTQWAMKPSCLAAAVLWLGAITTSLGAEKSLLNLDKQGVAIQGYDPVAFFTIQAPVKGKPEFKSTFHGATYWFHSAKAKASFDAKPEKYEPRFGGYCAYGVSKGRLIEIDVEAFQIVDGQLLLQYSKGVRNDFNKDAAANLKKADANWPRLVEEKGK